MRAVALAAEPTTELADTITTGLWSAIEPEFLALLSWDPAVKVLTLPQEHPLLGWKVCAVQECRKAARSIDDLCTTCRKRRTSIPELSWEGFLSTRKPHRRSIELGHCTVAPVSSSAAELTAAAVFCPPLPTAGDPAPAAEHVPGAPRGGSALPFRPMSGGRLHT